MFMYKITHGNIHQHWYWLFIQCCIHICVPHNWLIFDFYFIYVVFRHAQILPKHRNIHLHFYNLHLQSDGQCNVPHQRGRVVEVSAGGYHTVLCFEDGSVTAFGRNVHFPANGVSLVWGGHTAFTSYLLLYNFIVIVLIVAL